MENEVSLLVRVLDYSMLCVKYSIRAYNVVCGMIRLGYVPSVLLDASLEISTSPNQCLLSFHVAMINDLFCVSNNTYD